MTLINLEEQVMNASRPLILFSTLFQKMEKIDPWLASIVCLATASKDAKPSARIVLLKHITDTGLVFFTNTNSRKSRDLSENANAALCFHWVDMGLQIRIEGPVQPIVPRQADNYWQTRPRESQIGAWASNQSQTLSSKEVLTEQNQQFTEQFENQNIPRPDNWSGYELLPKMFEFWQDQPHRLHHRFLFEKQENQWKKRLLYP